MGLQYYITTLTNAFGKILPVAGYLVLAYIVFIKLPFLLLLKVKKENSEADAKVTDKTLEGSIDLKKLQKNIKIEEEVQKDKAFSEEKRKFQQKAYKKSEKKKQEKSHTQKEPLETKKPYVVSAEEIFQLKPGQVVSKNELKKKYHELLKRNHPDKVETLGNDFKKLAEQKTKDINQAYQKLKSKAS